MSSKSPRCSLAARLGSAALLGAALLGLPGCGALDGVTQRAAGLITPYRADVVQGNFVSREQVAALQMGMSRLQVRDVLGTPLVTSVFHADRWDYVFALKRRGQTEQTRRLSVFFDGDALVRFEGDELPSEADFVASIAPSKPRGPLPNLQASEESLKRFAPTTASAPTAPSAAAPVGAGPAGMPAPTGSAPSAPGAAAFPPLEAPTR